jgi:hypothetical protein
MPDRRQVKWGEMKAGDSHLSEEWHDMEPSSGHMSERYVDMKPSAAKMSEKWVDMEAGEPKGDQWHEMKQEKRIDPYSMAPDYDDREVGMKKQSSNPMKNSGHGRYQISGSEGQIGKGL